MKYPDESHLIPNPNILNQDELYRISDQNIDSLIREISKLFQKFTNDNDLVALKDAITKISEAKELARKNVTFFCNVNNNDNNNSSQSPNTPAQYDLAFCLRKYASIIIRDKNDDNRMSKARAALEEALSLYKDGKNRSQEITKEIQRTLHQLRKVAYDTKDGKLLEESVAELLASLENEKNNYTLNCYESMFHLEFAKHNYEKALDYANQCLNIFNHLYPLHTLFFHSSNNKLEKFTFYRHKAKISLAESLQPSCSAGDREYYLNDSEDTFWKAYDEHKKYLGLNDPKYYKIGYQNILKDLIFLFSLRCQKSLLGMDKGRKPQEYIMQEARKVLKDKAYFNKFKDMLEEKIDSIKEDHNLPLDYKIFEGYEPPMINFTDEEILTLFPEQPTNRSHSSQDRRLANFRQKF